MATTLGLLRRAWREDEGVLSFEWVLLLTLLVIGIVGGIAVVRDAIIDELGDVAEAAVSFDQSFFVAADDELGIKESSFTDDLPDVSDDSRRTLAAQQGDITDGT